MILIGGCCEGCARALADALPGVETVLVYGLRDALAVIEQRRPIAALFCQGFDGENDLTPIVRELRGRVRVVPVLSKASAVERARLIRAGAYACVYASSPTLAAELAEFTEVVRWAAQLRDEVRARPLHARRPLARARLLH